MTPNDLLAQVGPRILEKANLIWNVANSLAGPFKPHEYGLVILPMATANGRMQSGGRAPNREPTGPISKWVVD